MPEITFRVRNAKPCPLQGGNEKAWREAVAEDARRALGQVAFPKPPASTKFAVDLRFRVREFASAQHGDLDNLAKVVLDTLFRACTSSITGVMFDIEDAQVFRLDLEKAQVSSEQDEGVDVRVVWE